MFVRSGSTWTQRGQKFFASGVGGFNPEGNNSVALSANGDTALLTGTIGNVLASGAWSFSRSDGRWTRNGNTVSGKNKNKTYLGSATVALSADGRTALIGRGTGLGEKGPWYVWVFTKSRR
jgi:hypothetical protein